MLTIAALVWASLATVGSLAAAWVRWRAGTGSETAHVWQEMAEAYRAKAEHLESAVADLTRRVEQIERENAVLRSLHDNSAEIAALRAGIAEIKTLIVGTHA